MRISIVVAYDRERAIGVDGGLPWHLPDDLKRFKALTLGKPMLMGRRTAQSLGRALPGRLNLVLTRSGRVPFDGMEPVPSIEAALDRVRAEGAEELAVIGGGGVFEATLPIATWLHLTLVDTAVARSDTWFPPFPLDEWSEVARTHHAADATHAHAFDFVDLVRAKPART
ncbi:dihydrofolate reductase [Cognatilysobacter lacus]|uniref:Dihydrofolate reductase n=1 Tax=Cognatilysobacter lacus TaxID=1643323 RepID=A0A5D8Z5N3_9GAMM|nr:dihydrofolate reductase [Lysobacter lacus]TZF90295.1 dihydrofolate reductase [Lysobacter lacus]